MITAEQRLRNLQVPQHPIDVVLDTDAYNEIDDQFAIAYLLRSKEKCRTVALYAAPFLNHKATSPADGMEKSYHEILHVLSLLGKDSEGIPVYRGAKEYLPSEQQPVLSDAARDLSARAMQYTPEAPLYVVAIGAITNIASAVLLNPAICDRMVVVWLGGHARHFHHTREFNMMQDYAAARVIMGSGVPFVQAPCMGVVSEFRISGPELQAFLYNKTPLSDYLARNTVAEAEAYAAGRPWSRVIWDVVAVAWLLNEGGFLYTRTEQTQLPDYTGVYEEPSTDLPMTYIYAMERDVLMQDLIRKLTMS